MPPQGISLEMADFLERKITLGGSSFQVRLEGDGPALLMLHGYTGSIETMASLSALLRKNFCVISIDLPGHGRTSVSGDSAGYTFSQCSDALARILDELHIDKCFICGYSMGGRMSLVFTVNFPSRISALATIGASGGIESGKKREQRKAEDENLARFIESEGIEAFVRRWLDHPLFASQKKLGKAFREKAYRQRLNNNPASLACSLRGMGTGSQTPVYAGLGKIDLPMLFIAGKEDKKFCGLAQQLKRSCLQGHTRFIDGAGHAAHLENGDITAEAIAGFFQRFTKTVSYAKTKHQK